MKFLLVDFRLSLIIWILIGDWRSVQDLLQNIGHIELTIITKEITRSNFKNNDQIRPRN